MEIQAPDVAWPFMVVMDQDMENYLCLSTSLSLCLSQQVKKKKYFPKQRKLFFPCAKAVLQINTFQQV